MLTEKQIRSAISGVVSGVKPKAEVKDDGPHGGGRLTLSIRPSTSGALSEWYAVWHRSGVRHSTKIGTYPELTLAKARTLYRESYQPDILAGKDPQGPRGWTRGKDPTVEDLFKAYIASLRAKGKKTAYVAEKILLGPKGLVHTIGPHRRPADITPEDVIAHLKPIHARGAKVLASNTRGWGRAAFQFGISSKNAYYEPSAGTDWGLTINLIASIPSDPDAKRARTRFLNTQEFKALWDWCLTKEPFLRYRTCFALRLMMLTGQRVTEVFRIEDVNYSRDDPSLYWPTTKNGRPHIIPLPRQAVEILDGLTPNEHGLYFWRKTYPDQPIGHDGLAQILGTYFKETGAAHFEARDLRRTWKTLAGKVGLTKELRDRLQNHALKDVSSIHYDQYDYWAEKEAAMNRWQIAVDQILGATSPQSVAQLRQSHPTLLLAGPGVIETNPEAA